EEGAHARRVARGVETEVHPGARGPGQPRLERPRARQRTDRVDAEAARQGFAGHAAMGREREERRRYRQRVGLRLEANRGLREIDTVEDDREVAHGEDTHAGIAART